MASDTLNQTWHFEVEKQKYIKVTWHTAKYGDPYSESVLCIYPSKCTHTVGNAHTLWTHTWIRGQPLLRRPGSSWGFGFLLKGTSVGVLRVERALDIHSPNRQTLPTETLQLSNMSSLPLEHKLPNYLIIHIRKYQSISLSNALQ